MSTPNQPTEELRQARRSRRALEKVIIDLIADDTELFRQFMDNADFKKWLADTVFGLTFERGSSAA